MTLRNLALVAAGTVFLACTSFAQITTVEGDVKGIDGKPVQNAQIKITRTDIKGNYDTKTNKKGHYIYMGLPMGTCAATGGSADFGRSTLCGQPRDEPRPAPLRYMGFPDGKRNGAREAGRSKS